MTRELETEIMKRRRERGGREKERRERKEKDGVKAEEGRRGEVDFPPSLPSRSKDEVELGAPGGKFAVAALAPVEGHRPHALSGAALSLPRRSRARRYNLSALTGTPEMRKTVSPVVAGAAAAVPEFHSSVLSDVDASSIAAMSSWRPSWSRWRGCVALSEVRRCCSGGL